MKRTERFVNRDLVVRGSLITLRRRCGKPTCHCADDQPHATPALSYSIGGSTKMLTLRPQDLAMVKAALARYRKARAELDKRALRGIAVLRAHIAQEKSGRHVQSR